LYAIDITHLKRIRISYKPHLILSSRGVAGIISICEFQAQFSLINWKNVYTDVLNIIDTYSRKYKRVLARYKPIKNKQKEQQKNILGEAMKNV
jgi:hypothetical protein